MTDAYLQGFMDKCAEAGIDPQALVKDAGLFGYMGDVARRGFNKATQPITNFGERVGKEIGRNVDAAKASWGRGMQRVNNVASAVGNGMARAGNYAMDRLGDAGDKMIAGGRAIGREWNRNVAAANDSFGRGFNRMGATAGQAADAAGNFFSPVIRPFQRVGEEIGNDYAAYETRTNPGPQNLSDRLTALRQRSGYNRRLADYRMRRQQLSAAQMPQLPQGAPGTPPASRGRPY